MANATNVLDITSSISPNSDDLGNRFVRSLGYILAESTVLLLRAFVHMVIILATTSGVASVASPTPPHARLRSTPPSMAKRIQGGWRVEDATGYPLAYVYGTPALRSLNCRPQSRQRKGR
jgi:hypothetical protein